MYPNTGTTFSLIVPMPDLPGSRLTLAQSHNMITYRMEAAELFKGSIPANRAIRLCRCLTGIAVAETYDTDDPRRWHWYEKNLIDWLGQYLSIQVEQHRIIVYELLESGEAEEPMLRGRVPVEYARFLGRALKTARAWYLLGDE